MQQQMHETNANKRISALEKENGELKQRILKLERNARRAGGTNAPEIDSDEEEVSGASFKPKFNPEPMDEPEQKSSG